VFRASTGPYRRWGMRTTPLVSPHPRTGFWSCKPAHPSSDESSGGILRPSPAWLHRLHGMVVVSALNAREAQFLTGTSDDRS